MLLLCLAGEHFLLNPLLIILPGSILGLWKNLCHHYSVSSETKGKKWTQVKRITWGQAHNKFSIR